MVKMTMNLRTIKITDNEDAWSEVDENELISSQVDTLLTAPDFVEPSEKQDIYNFAPGEDKNPCQCIYAR